MELVWIFSLIGSKDLSKNWDIAKYKRKVGDDEFYQKLSEINDVDDYLRVLKYSEFFTTRNVSEMDKVLQKEKIYKLFPRDTIKINNFFGNIKLLDSLYNEFENTVKKVNEFLKTSGSATALYFYDALNYNIYNFYKGNDYPKELVPDLQDTAINLYSIILNDIKKHSSKFVHSKQPLDSNVLNSIVNDYQDYSRYFHIKDIWMYSEFETTNTSEGVVVNEVGEFSKKYLSSKINYLDDKEIREKEIKESYNKNYEDFLKAQYELAKRQISTYFYTEDFSQEYSGIALEQWMQSYLKIVEITIRKFKELANYGREHSNRPIQSLLHYYSYKELLEEFKTIDDRNYEVLLNSLIFNSESNKDRAVDLYDAPLILDEDSVFISPMLINSIDFSRAIISTLGRKAKDLEKKGENCEKYLSELTKTNFDCITNLKSTGQNNSEVDIVFYDNGKLVFVELKTQKQPESYYEYFKFLNERKNYLEKFNKNVDNTIKNKFQVLEEKFNLGNTVLEDIDVIKIFVSNVPSIEQVIDGIYITNEFEYSKFMKREIINNSQIKEVFEGQASIVKLITLIEFNNTNRLAKERIDYRSMPMLLHKKTVIKVNGLVVDERVKTM